VPSSPNANNCNTVTPPTTTPPPSIKPVAVTPAVPGAKIKGIEAFHQPARTAPSLNQPAVIAPAAGLLPNTGAGDNLGSLLATGAGLLLAGGVLLFRRRLGLGR
jgi:LPXTG-motif cell wall-anchored protein